MASTIRTRRILHVDLDSFLVSVERSLDPALRGAPLLIGGDGRGSGVVAAASAEARETGVKAGQSLAQALKACPSARVRPGDFEAYARVSQDVTGILTTVSRRVERPSADEAYLDLTPDGSGGPGAVGAAELVKDELQRRLGLDASLGLASSRLAARVASSWARPRGLLVVLPGYESSFLARQAVTILPDLPYHLEVALAKAGITTLGELLAADEATLVHAVGGAASALREAASGEGEEPIALAAPPTSIHEEASLRSSFNDREGIDLILDGLSERACRRLRPFGLAAGSVSVEVGRAEGALRRTQTMSPGIRDADTAKEVVRSLASPLLEVSTGVRSVSVRLARLATPKPQVPLFPELSGLAR